MNLNEVFKNATFDKNNLNSIYEIKIGDYSYRGINYQKEDGTYTQVLINIDSEKTIAEKFIKNLVISFSVTIVIILIASYVLSKWTLKPIIISWKKQTQFVQDASHELRTPLAIIKAKQESVYIIKRENHKVADAAYIKSNLAGISPKDIRASVKRKQKAGCELKQNQSPAAVVL